MVACLPRSPDRSAFAPRQSTERTNCCTGPRSWKAEGNAGVSTVTAPIDIPALKAAAKECIRPTEDSIDIVEMSRRYQRFRVLTQPTTVLALIERLETAEHRLMSLGYRRACDIPPCNCGDRWAHKLACPIGCSCYKCELDRAGIALDILRDELRADGARLEKLEAVATAARVAMKHGAYRQCTGEHGPHCDCLGTDMREALAALKAAP